MSFYTSPTPWDPRYAIPDYVMAEPPGRGTFTTKGPRRGTIQNLIADPLSGYDDVGYRRNSCHCKGVGDIFDPSTWADYAKEKAAAFKAKGEIPWVPIAIGAAALILILKRKK